MNFLVQIDNRMRKNELKMAIHFCPIALCKIIE